MTRMSLLIDLQRCVGCMSCIVACKMENSVPVGTNWNRVEQVGPVGTFPADLKMYYFPKACMHCMNPACVEACPLGATAKNEEGIVVVDPEICIGCVYCVEACPYGARSIDPTTEKAVKCTLCLQLLEEGQKPSCVHHCMAYARFYGDLDDPANEIDEYLNQPGNKERSFHYMEEQGTGPSVTYLEPKCGMLTEAAGGA